MVAMNTGPGPTIRRSLNLELIEGATDGSAKKSSPNRAVGVHNSTEATRKNLFAGQNGYGVRESGAAALDIMRGVVRGL